MLCAQESRRRQQRNQECSRDRLTTEIRRLRETPKSCLGLTDFTLHTALAILSMANINMKLAVDWLMLTKRRGHRLDMDVTREQIEAVLTQIIIASNADEITGWSDPTRCSLLPSLRAASSYVQNQDLVCMISKANAHQGRAPSSRNILNFLNSHRRLRNAPGWKPARVGNRYRPSLSSPRTYMNKWRKKHGVEFGKVRFGEPLTLSQKRQKVTRGIWRRPFGIAARFLGSPTFFGAGKRPYFGGLPL